MTQPCSIAPAPPDDARVTGSYLQPLLDTARERGLALEVLAQAAGMAPSSLDPLPESLPARRYIALLEAGARLAHDPFFGLHVGEKAGPATYSAYGMLLLACNSFGHALELTQRYESLAHDLGRSALALDGARAHYEWISHYPDATRHLVESVFAGIRVFGSWLAGQPLMPLALRLRHPDPGHGDAEYLRVLGVAPEFDAPRNCATVDAALLAMPVPNADTSLFPLLHHHADRLLAKRAAQQEQIVAQVRAALLPRLAGGKARLAPVAAELGLSPRTLQRKLAEAGSSYQEVLDTVRFGLAQDYLRRRELGLVDIAFLLGFQEQSAFTHAFREWSGMNPGAWREQVG
ncbi:AraC family transcriptional regulator [Massilia sp. HP4]|uniref:AraC family transcriptional regulator n=1 Tax=Massilia sp. HP4 TaxID=2562316 RepID=UPI0010C074BE|nr:AraC family transcriptional regulator [Massilia sp. HP4]